MCSSSNCSSQVQTLRTADTTLSEIKAQLTAAMTGVKAPVDKRQTQTGIKDALAQYWIEKLIDEARKLRQGPGKLTQAQTVAQLDVWLKAQTDQAFNPLFAMPGKY